MATFNTPDGRKLRVASQRRYIVVRLADARPVIEYRTDDRNRALARRSGISWRVLDTVKGEWL